MRFIYPLFAILVTVLALAGTAHAQDQVPGAGPPSADIPLPDTLNEVAIRRVLSELDDRQVRALLLERLRVEADRQAEQRAVAGDTGLGDVVAAGAGAFGAFLADVIEKVPRLPGEIAKAFVTFTERRESVGLWRFFMTLAVSLGLGGVAAIAAARFIPAPNGAMPASHRPALWKRAGVLALRLALQAAVVAVFGFCALAANAWVNLGFAADQETVSRIVAAIVGPWFAYVIARFLFAPRRADLRLCPIDDADARWLTIRIVLVATIFYAGFGFTSWLNAFGSIFRDSWHGFWINILLHVALALTVWQGRFILRRILSGGAVSTDDADMTEPFLHRSWSCCIGL